MRIDTNSMTPQEIQDTLVQLQKAAARTSAKEDALTSMDHTLQDRLQAEGIGPGGEWVAPGDASDGYPRKWVVWHNGELWASLWRVNTDEPGTSDAWERIELDSPA